MRSLPAIGRGAMATPERDPLDNLQQCQRDLDSVQSSSKANISRVARNAVVSAMVAAQWERPHRQQGIVTNLPITGRKPVMNKEAIASAVAVMEQQFRCSSAAAGRGHLVHVSTPHSPPTDVVAGDGTTGTKAGGKHFCCKYAD